MSHQHPWQEFLVFSSRNSACAGAPSGARLPACFSGFKDSRPSLEDPECPGTMRSWQCVVAGVTRPSDCFPSQNTLPLLPVLWRAHRPMSTASPALHPATPVPSPPCLPEKDNHWGQMPLGVCPLCRVLAGGGGLPWPSSSPSLPVYLLTSTGAKASCRAWAWLLCCTESVSLPSGRPDRGEIWLSFFTCLF